MSVVVGDLVRQSDQGSQYNNGPHQGEMFLRPICSVLALEENKITFCSGRVAVGSGKAQKNLFFVKGVSFSFIYYSHLNLF